MEVPDVRSRLKNFQVAPGEIEDDRYAIQENDKMILIMEDDKIFAQHIA